MEGHTCEVLLLNLKREGPHVVLTFALGRYSFNLDIDEERNTYNSDVLSPKTPLVISARPCAGIPYKEMEEGSFAL